MAEHFHALNAAIRGTRRGIRRVRSGELSFVALALVVVFGSLLGIVVLQTIIVQNRVDLDDVSRQLETAREANQRLRLDVLELEAPDRVLTVAVNRLGMIRPDERRYLPGIDPAVAPVAMPVGDDPFGPGPLPPELRNEPTDAGEGEETP